MSLADELLRVPVQAIRAFGPSVDRRHLAAGQPPGAAHPQAAFTDEKAEAIRAEYEAGGISYRQLARKHGVGYGTISALLKRQSYGRRGQPPGEQHTNAKLTAAKAGEIRLRYAMGGETYVTLAEQFGVTAYAIRDVIKGRSYKG